ncbi:MAG: amino acid deaminase/aldolase, partial [Cellulosimicrobium funkei]
MTTHTAPGADQGAGPQDGDERGATPSLLARLTRATATLDGPLAVVDLDRFDANADELLARAGGVPVRVASKSVRVRSLVARAGERGFQGVRAYS